MTGLLTPSLVLACVDFGPYASIRSIECQSKYALANVNIMPGHKNTTLAIVRPLCLYANGLPPYAASNRCDSAAFVPVTYADLVATMSVYARASARASMHARTAQAFQAILTEGDSWRSGQKRSKKNAAPKIVATKMPTKMSGDVLGIVP